MCYRVIGTLLRARYAASRIVPVFVASRSESLKLLFLIISELQQLAVAVKCFLSEFSDKFEFLCAKTCASLSCISCLEQGVIDCVPNVAKQHVRSAGNKKQGLFVELILAPWPIACAVPVCSV